MRPSIRMRGASSGSHLLSANLLPLRGSAGIIQSPVTFTPNHAAFDPSSYRKESIHLSILTTLRRCRYCGTFAPQRFCHKASEILYLKSQFAHPFCGTSEMYFALGACSQEEICSSTSGLLQTLDLDCFRNSITTAPASRAANGTRTTMGHFMQREMRHRG